MNESHIVSLLSFSFSLNSLITIQFLYYKVFRPLFLAIVRYYVTLSTLPAVTPQLTNVYKGGRSCCCVQNRFLVVDSVDSLLSLT
jgi:hypothetical protein